MTREATEFSGRVGNRDYQVAVEFTRARVDPQLLAIDGVGVAIPRSGGGWVMLGEDRRLRTAGLLPWGREVTVQHRSSGEWVDREVIRLRTSLLRRGAGEVDVRSAGDLQWHPLAPAAGSRADRWELHRAEHIPRAALVAGVGTSAKYLVPLLGIPALIDRITQPAQDRAAEAARPVADTLAALLEPVGRIIGAVLGFLFGWIPPLLGWIPDVDLPDWVGALLIPMLVVLFSALGEHGRLRRRARLLEAQRARRDRT
ncbi:hypothetical protein JSY14_05465 [Brachybacterium sp. EF45031]|uniref:hypothetical protein n=1 Tax=Brachybacterium sillae TaxID=2810536 RepID=UPI00217E5A5D|nr:hypothetical protein [Brachybacterium sillae]MCS6711500.1 hypothetical protein [Brachybacterium sillae]